MDSLIVPNSPWFTQLQRFQSVLVSAHEPRTLIRPITLIEIILFEFRISRKEIVRMIHDSVQNHQRRQNDKKRMAWIWLGIFDGGATSAFIGKRNCRNVNSNPIRSNDPRLTFGSPLEGRPLRVIVERDMWCGLRRLEWNRSKATWILTGAKWRTMVIIRQHKASASHGPA